MAYTTVFEIGKGGVNSDVYTSALIMLFIIGTLLYFSKYSRRKKQIRTGGALMLVAIAPIYAYIAWSQFSAASSCYEAFKANRFSVVEGQVEDFLPMPYEGHQDEKFHVGPVHFSYSDYDDSPGFHQSTSHGGPIREGLQVRISYSDDCSDWPRTILKLEVQAETP